MTTTDPFLPHPDDDGDRTPAADPGRGAPPFAPGAGPAAEEPDRTDDATDDAAGRAPSDTPFRTPEVPGPA